MFLFGADVLGLHVVELLKKYEIQPTISSWICPNDHVATCDWPHMITCGHMIIRAYPTADKQNVKLLAVGFLMKKPTANSFIR